jgi:acetylglutamate kinase
MAFSLFKSTTPSFPSSLPPSLPPLLLPSFPFFTCAQVMKDGKASLGFVGEPKRVDVTILNDFLNAGIIPVIAPIGISETGETLNINADTAAGKIAGALRAKRLLLLTDVAGVLDKEKVLIPHLKLKQVGEGGKREGGKERGRKGRGTAAIGWT